MKTISQSRPRVSFGLLLVGPPKSGKSIYTIRTFPNIYVCDLDNNLTGPVSFLEDKKALPNFSYDTIDLLDDGTECPPEKRWSRMIACTKVAVASPDIDTVFIDGLTKLSNNLISHILAAERQENMRIQDWLSYQNLMNKFVTYLRSSGKLIIMSAHETVEEDEYDKVLKHFIAIPSKLRHTLAGLFTDAWRAEYKPGAGGAEGVYSLRTVSTSRMSLGNSLGLPVLFPMNEDLVQKKLTALFSKQTPAPTP